METKFAIDQKDGDYSDEKYFRRLIRSIEVSQKYFLFFVACNQIPRQNELIADIKAELPTKNIEVINFKEPITDLLFELETISGDKSPDAIFVQGLGSSISSDGTGDANNLIYALNISRDSFNDAFQCPIYLWLPEYAVIKITRNAPDYFSVRSGVFYFSSTAEQVISDIFQSTSSEWLETSSLPVAEKQKRILMLESLLAEYQGLDEDKRDKQAEMRLYEQLADLFYSISKYDKAIDYYYKALAIAFDLDNFESQARYCSELGNICNERDDHVNAIEFNKLALKISKLLKNKRDEGVHLGNLGNSYLISDNPKKAINYLKRALSISKKESDEMNSGIWLTNLGAAYFSLDDYKKSVEYYKQALEILRKTGNKQTEVNNLGNLGNTYNTLGEYKKAIECYEQALEISKEIGYRQGEGKNLGSLGTVYHNLAENEKAKEYYVKAIEISEAIESADATFFRDALALLQ